MLNVELQVRSSTMLSQVELCFICPQFSFFPLSRTVACLPLRRVPAHPPASLLVRFLFVFFFADFLFCSPITALCRPSC
jgi:hypothetical protein